MRGAHAFMTPHIAMANGKEPVVGVAPDIHDEDMPQLRKSYDETDEEGLVHGAWRGLGGSVVVGRAAGA